MIINAPGIHIPPGIGKLFDPCSDVYTIAIHIIVLLYDISKIYPDTKFQR